MAGTLPPMRRLLALLVPLAVLAGCADDDAGDAIDGATTTVVDDVAQDRPADPTEDGEAESETAEGEATDATTETTVPADAPAADAPESSVDETDGVDDPGVLVADLAGPAEVPGPGDDGAAGRFEAELVDGRLCIDMIAEDLDSGVSASHVHEGAAGAAGPPVVSIGPPTASDGPTDSWNDVCVDVERDLVERMATAPDQFYVNVHSSTFPDGAVRGQLALASIFDRTLS